VHIWPPSLSRFFAMIGRGNFQRHLACKKAKTNHGNNSFLHCNVAQQQQQQQQQQLFLHHAGGGWLALASIGFIRNDDDDRLRAAKTFSARAFQSLINRSFRAAQRRERERERRGKYSDRRRVSPINELDNDDDDDDGRHIIIGPLRSNISE
jgi:hypothetical protein